MSTYRNKLPQLADQIFLTDGGLETTLIFDQGYDLPLFAGYPLLNSATGREAISAYYEPYAATAAKKGCGFVFEGPTWRASRDWGAQLGHSSETLAEINRQAIDLMERIRDSYATDSSPMVVSGCVGPRGDGYLVGEIMTVAESQKYHSEQVEVIAGTNADMVCALTMTYPEEAIGIALAAKSADIPVVVSFTTETDGLLPNGDTLADAINATDEATENGPAYYMLNCAHPDHFVHALAKHENWTQRIRGVRANASRCSHAELDEAEELDRGIPAEFGQLYAELVAQFPWITILGGCCGTDHEHIHAITEACC